MKFSIQWLGHAAFLITANDGTVILVDPWLTNPVGVMKVEDLKRVDIVLITHDHDDHVGDAGEILKKFPNATLIAQPELTGRLLRDYGFLPEQIKNGNGMNIGGTVEVCGIKITMVEATHSSETGEPSGFMIDIDGDVIYHAGDTGLTGAMQYFAKLYAPRVALLPVGSVYTMDVRAAAMAADIINAECVIPMHYGTFPILTQSAEGMQEMTKADVLEIAPGRIVEFE